MWNTRIIFLCADQKMAYFFRKCVNFMIGPPQNFNGQVSSHTCMIQNSSERKISLPKYANLKRLLSQSGVAFREVIHPASHFNSAMVLISGVLLLYSGIFTPFEIGFNWDTPVCKVVFVYSLLCVTKNPH